MISGTAGGSGSVVGGWVFAGTVTDGCADGGADGDRCFSVVVPFAVVVPPLVVVVARRVEGTSGPSVSRSRLDSSDSAYRLTPF